MPPALPFELTLANIAFLVECLILAIAIFGQMLMRFESDWSDKGAGTIPKSHTESFLSLTVACTLFTVASTSFVPTTCRNSLRTFATFVYFANIEQAICGVADFIQTDWTSSMRGTALEEQYNTVRAGQVISMMALFPAFFIAHLIPRNGRDIREIIKVDSIKKSLITPRFALWFVAAGFFFMGQILTWSVYKNCSSKYNSNKAMQLVPLMNVIPMLIVFLTIISHLYDDKEMIDFVIFWTTKAGIETIRPIFTDDESPFTGDDKQDSFKGVWRAAISFLYIGCILYVCGTVAHAVIKCRDKNTPSFVSTLKVRLMSKQFVAFIFLAIFGFAGAVCVYTRAPQSGASSDPTSRTRVYFATLAILIPPIVAAAWLLRFEGVALVAAIWCAQINYGSTLLTQQPVASGYLRGGLLIVIWVLVALPIIYYSANMAIATAEKYFEPQNRSLILSFMTLMFCALVAYSTNQPDYILFFLSAMLLMAAASTENKDCARLVFFLLINLITMGSYWPLSSGFKNNATTVLGVIVAYYYICSHAWNYLGMPWICMHEDSEYSSQLQSTAVPLAPGAESSYVPVSDLSESNEEKRESSTKDTDSVTNNSEEKKDE